MVDKNEAFILLISLYSTIFAPLIIIILLIKLQFNYGYASQIFSSKLTQS